MPVNKIIEKAEVKATMKKLARPVQPPENELPMMKKVITKRPSNRLKRFKSLVSIRNQFPVGAKKQIS
tara:strand:+ start:164 stop:367 length:204 start_codon:yes stop_codon:yes gene_type:complete